MAGCYGAYIGWFLQRCFLFCIARDFYNTHRNKHCYTVSRYRAVFVMEILFAET